MALLIISTHPRTKQKLDSQSIKMDKKIEFLKPLGLFDYVNLQLNSFCVISDSGTITEESSILNFPAITIRQAHERPEGMDQGTLIMSGLEKTNVINSIEIVVSHLRESKNNIVSDYDVDNFSKKVTKIIFSYIGYINRTVWHK